MRFKKLDGKSIKELREICQNAPGYLPEKLFRKVSLYISIACIYLGISATAVTFARFIIGVIGIGIIAMGGLKAAIIGLLVFHFAILLDYVDGEIFRYQTWKTGKKESFLKGSFLDKVFDHLYRPILMFAAGLWAYNSGYGILFLYLGMFGAFLVSTDQVLKLKIFEVLVYKQQLNYLRETKKKLESDSGKLDGIYELFRINNPLTLYFWFGIFGYLHYFLIIYVPLLILLVGRTFYTQYANIISMDKEILSKLYKGKKH